jgi:hypothetical protein
MCTGKHLLGDLRLEDKNIIRDHDRMWEYAIRKYKVKAASVASGTEVRGFKPGRSRLKNPQHTFLRRGSKTVCPMSQIRGMLKNPIITAEVAIVD